MKSKGKEGTFLSSEEEEGEGVACRDCGGGDSSPDCGGSRLNLGFLTTAKEARTFAVSGAVGGNWEGRRTMLDLKRKRSCAQKPTSEIQIALMSRHLFRNWNSFSPLSKCVLCLWGRMEMSDLAGWCPLPLTPS